MFELACPLLEAGILVQREVEASERPWVWGVTCVSCMQGSERPWVWGVTGVSYMQGSERLHVYTCQLGAGQ